MQTTAIRTVANSLPEKGVILLTLLISDRYILFAELRNLSWSEKEMEQNPHSERNRGLHVNGLPRDKAQRESGRQLCVETGSGQV